LLLQLDPYAVLAELTGRKIYLEGCEASEPSRGSGCGHWTSPLPEFEDDLITSPGWFDELVHIQK